MAVISTRLRSKEGGGGRWVVGSSEIWKELSISRAAKKEMISMHFYQSEISNVTLLSKILQKLSFYRKNPISLSLCY